jgi:carboxypeptidase PM20D1
MLIRRPLEVFMFANVLIVLIVAFLFLAAFILVRTIQYGRASEPVEGSALITLDGEVVAEHLAAAIRYRTVSEMDREKMDYQPFLDLRSELESLYPRVHTTLRVETVNRYSLFYTWKGKNEALEPILLAGHIDVVPVDPATRDDWRHPPFSGQIDDGYVWGRGALDTKCSVIAIFDAVETLIKSGYQPERTVLLAIGHDEEIGGLQGASQIAGRIQAYNTRLAAVIDEGGSIMTSGVVPGVRVPVALVGVAEKGYMSLQVLVEGQGGHSSMPPRHTAIGVLGRALARLEENPLPAHMRMVKLTYDNLAAYLSFGMRASYANLWMFGPLLRNRIESASRTRAMIHTTTAVTMISGGLKDNILPSKAAAVVNFRLMPGERIADVVTHARKVVGDDAVQFNIPEGVCWESPPISPVDSLAYRGLAQAIGQVFPEAAAAPYLVLGATDARYYTAVCDQVYRFSPCIMTEDEMKSVHGVNERIAIDNLARMVQFYIQIVKIWGVE